MANFLTNIHFCHRWFEGRLVDPMTAEEAKTCWQRGDGYGGVIGDPKGPLYMFSIGATGAALSKRDDKGRSIASWNINQTKGSPAIWFLDNLIEREFYADSKLLAKVINYGFQVEGATRIDVFEYAQRPQKPIRTSIFSAKADVSDFFMPRPGFAELEQLLRLREIKIVPGSIGPYVPPA